MDSNAPDLDERLTQIEDQLDRVTAALRLFIERTEARATAIETRAGTIETSVADRTARLESELTARCAELDAALSARSAALSQAVAAAVTAMAARNNDSAKDAKEMRRRTVPISTIAIVAAGLVILVALVFWSRRGAGVNAASTTAAAGDASSASRTASAASDESGREMAARSQAINDVLTASDLARFDLSGTHTAANALAKLRWSRSHGLVFTGSGFPEIPTDMTYEIWLMTTAGPVSAGLVTPDSLGRVTLIADAPASTAPVAGARVTIEPSGGSSQPTGALVLVAR